MPSQITTAGANTALAYSVGRHIEELCDGSYLVVVQTSATTLTLYQVTSPGGTPTFTALAQTFTIAGSTNILGDLFILNNGSTTSDVWLAYASNGNNNGLFVAHAVYTPGGGTVWDWSSNTGTQVSVASPFCVPSIVWTGTNLILATRWNVSNFEVDVFYTGTKAGNTGWNANYKLSQNNTATSHFYPQLLHDATNQCTIAFYSEGAGPIVARVIPDGTIPSAQASWSAEASFRTTEHVGAANLGAVLDTANKRIHVIYIDSTAGATNPYYNTATYTTTAITPATEFSVATAAQTMAGVDIGLDNSGAVWLFWSTAAVGNAADIEYVKLVSPYGSGNLGSVTNLTNATANDNAYPHVPRQTLLSGFIPLIYEHATGSFPVEYDNSITLVSTVNGSGSFVASGVLLDTMTPVAAQGVLVENQTIPVVAQGILLNATDLLVPDSPAGVTGSVILASVSFVSSGVLTNSAAQPGTGIGGLTISTQPQSWSGGPPGSPGTETDVTYEDSTGSGTRWGILPTYGAAIATSLYQVDNGVAGTNLHSLRTSRPDGPVHEDNQSSGGIFGSDEDSAYTLTEQTPIGTDFRRYYKGTWGPDANGFNWAIYACIYPGDPQRIAYRFDLINPTASAIALASSDALEFGVIAALDPGIGVWVYTNGGYGQLGAAASTWPTASTNGNPVAADPDYAYIIPSSGSIGRLTALKQRVSTLSPALGSPQVSALVDSARLKLKVYGSVTGNSFPGSTTQTTYLLSVVRRNLTAADAAAISADYIQPGTPTGPFTSYSYDEGAYVFAASANAITTTLDMSPTHVTVRYKPVLKITSWSGGVPVITWGGGALTAGTDYRWLEDVTNSVLYVQLYFDVVSSGAVAGQRNNAALAVSSSTITLSSNGVLTSPAKVLAPASEVSQGAVVVGMLPVVSAGGLSVSATIITAPTLTASTALSPSATLLTQANPASSGVLVDGMLPLVSGGIASSTATLLASPVFPAQGQLVEAAVVFSSNGMLQVTGSVGGAQLVASAVLTEAAQIITQAASQANGTLSCTGSIQSTASFTAAAQLVAPAVVLTGCSLVSNGVLQSAATTQAQAFLAQGALVAAADLVASVIFSASGGLFPIPTIPGVATTNDLSPATATTADSALGLATLGDFSPALAALGDN